MIVFALAMSVLSLLGATVALYRATAALNHFLELVGYTKSIDDQARLNTKQSEILKTGLDLALDRCENVSDRADLAMKVANDAFHAAKDNLQIVADYVSELRRLDGRQRPAEEAHVD